MRIGAMRSAALASAMLGFLVMAELRSVSAVAGNARAYSSLKEWIARSAIAFSPASSEQTNAALDKVVAALGRDVRLLGFGEALHGGEDILRLRNEFFKRLVEKHGYSAIAIESGFPEAHLVDAYIAGGKGTYADIARKGFGWSFGTLEANRDLVEWMRSYNSDPAHKVKLRFYGFDISAIGGARIYGPDAVLHSALDYLAAIDNVSAGEHRARIDALLGQLSGWENPDVFQGKAPAPGLTPAANSLRIATEDLITELRTRRPELVARSNADAYQLALQYAQIARQTLNFHAAVARTSAEPVAGLRGVRDALMADNLEYIVNREHGRGKVFVFAHNGHLQRGKSVWPCCGQKHWGTVYEWWPAGSQLKERLGARYAVIGSALGASDPQNGVGPADAGSLEAMLADVSGDAVIVPTHLGVGLPERELTALKPRSGSDKNMTYTTLERRSLTDFDWLYLLDRTRQTVVVPASTNR